MVLVKKLIIFYLGMIWFFKKVYLSSLILDIISPKKNYIIFLFICILHANYAFL
jgi:hypothetical protein